MYLLILLGNMTTILFISDRAIKVFAVKTSHIAILQIMSNMLSHYR